MIQSTNKNWGSITRDRILTLLSPDLSPKINLFVAIESVLSVAAISENWGAYDLRFYTSRYITQEYMSMSVYPVARALSYEALGAICSFENELRGIETTKVQRSEGRSNGRVGHG